jgi:hypothetical protein
MISLKDYDFKKAASSALKETDAEIAFYRASSTVMEDKASPFFTNDYYLGFEIVKTNDAFTKMVGIYVFRVNKHILYAPVFYVNGQVKGTEFLYNVDEKKFVYLNPDWCNYFIGLYEESGDGTAVDMSIANQGKQDIEMMRIATPLYKTSSLKKFASELNLSDTDQDDFSSFTSMYDSVFNTFVESKDVDYSPLHKFLKSAGIDAWNKLAEALKSDKEFANNVVGLCDESDYIPMDVLEEARTLQVKKASEASKPKNLLVLHKGIFNKNAVKTAAEQITKGYSFEDNRDEDQLNMIYDADPDQNWAGISTNAPSVYDILTTDGSTVRCVAIMGNSDYGKTPALLVSIDPERKGIIQYYDINSPEELYNKEDENVKAPGVHDPVVGNFRNILAIEEKDSDKREEDLTKVLKEKPEVGKIYGIWDPEYCYLSDEAFYVGEVKDNADDPKGYTVKVYPIQGYDKFKPWEALVQGTDEIIQVNPSAQYPMYDLKVFQPSMRWIELPTETIDLAKRMKAEFKINDAFSFKKKDYRIDIIQAEWVPGNWANLYANTLVKHSSVGHGYVNYNGDGSYNLNIAGFKFANVNVMGAMALLMGNVNISEETADYIIKHANTNQKRGEDYKFLFKKFADRIILNPDPDFFEGFDSDLNIPYEIPETRALMTDETSYAPPAPRYGDMMTPTLMDAASNTEGVSREDPSDFLQTATPNMLAEFAQRSGQRSVFEHGIVSVLSQVSDAQMYINDFLPSLRDGMDKLARLLFLIIISPQNFVKYYGSDDIKGLENSVLACFRQLSELTLDLIQKTSGISTNTTNKI